MLRHSRDMVRHHRERIIAKRKELYSQIFSYGIPDHLAKYSAHHHKCSMCQQRYNRSAHKSSWRNDLANY